MDTSIYLDCYNHQKNLLRGLKENINLLFMMLISWCKYRKIFKVCLAIFQRYE